jgi:hypothetical protein
LVCHTFNIFKLENAQSIIDLGAGKGEYTESMRLGGLFSNCYDGNPYTQQLSQGKCGMIDLSVEMKLMPPDWALCLEVGEHVPKEYEDILMENISNVTTKGIILSWALEGQGGLGHVNERSNDYIREKFISLGYYNDVQTENDLRDASFLPWFKNTIMVFRKDTDIEVTDHLVQDIDTTTMDYDL